MVENITSQKEIENELSELQKRLMHGREMERLGIAQELHDGPLQDLIDLTYQIHDLAETGLDGNTQDQLKNLRLTVNQVSRSIRTICGELRPPTLAPFGLGKTIKSHAQEFQESHPELKIQSGSRRRRTIIIRACSDCLVSHLPGRFDQHPASCTSQ